MVLEVLGSCRCRVRGWRGCGLRNAEMVRAGPESPTGAGSGQCGHMEGPCCVLGGRALVHKGQLATAVTPTGARVARVTLSSRSRVAAAASVRGATLLAKEAAGALLSPTTGLQSCRLLFLESWTSH